MSTGSGWHLDPDRLGGALEAWRRRCRRTRHRIQVHEFLMDLVNDPFACGQQDDFGLWIGYAGSVPRVVIVYYPERATRTVFVVNINYA